MAAPTILGFRTVIRTLSALSALFLIGAVVAGIATRCMHGGVRHRVCGEARRSVGVTVAALDAGHRDMRRRSIAGRDRPIVAT